jgi:hypothetical protein
LDERDGNFIALARKLLGRDTSRDRVKIVSGIKHPLSYLFGDDAAITDEAKSIDVKNIRIFRHH